MTQVKRGQIRNMSSYDRGVWDWSILEGCFGTTKISPTDIDGCIERRGRKLFLETKQPGAPVPTGQMMTLMSLVDDGHTVMIIWGSDKRIETIHLYTPFQEIVYKNADIEKLRHLVKQWFDFADGRGLDVTEPSRVARSFWRRKGRDYCDTMMAEWGKLDELEKRTRAGKVVSNV